MRSDDDIQAMIVDDFETGDLSLEQSGELLAAYGEILAQTVGDGLQVWLGRVDISSNVFHAKCSDPQRLSKAHAALTHFFSETESDASDLSIVTVAVNKPLETLDKIAERTGARVSLLYRGRRTLISAPKQAARKVPEHTYTSEERLFGTITEVGGLVRAHVKISVKPGEVYRCTLNKQLAESLHWNQYLGVEGKATIRGGEIVAFHIERVLTYQHLDARDVVQALSDKLGSTIRPLLDHITPDGTLDDSHLF